MRTKRLKAFMLCLILALCLSVLGACQPAHKTLTMAQLQTLSQKGESLSWQDFAPYESEDIGSGLYILRYDIDADYYLLLGGGSKETSPMYIRLVRASDPEQSIDIRTERIADFIG